jgi:hypothetical protein
MGAAMKLDFRKTALLAAVTLGLARMECFVTLISAFNTQPKDRWSILIVMGVNLLLLAPLPIMLALLYKTEITPAVSRKMRYLALATALVAGIFEALPRIIGLLQVVYQSLPYIHSYGGKTEAARLGRWLYHFYVPYVWGAVTLLSYLSVILFLVFLMLSKGDSSSGNERSACMVRRTALIATIVGGLAVGWNLFGQVYSAVKYTPRNIYGLSIFNDADLNDIETKLHFILRHSFSVIPLLCWLSVAWIVYKGIPRAAGTKRVEEMGATQD